MKTLILLGATLVFIVLAVPLGVLIADVLSDNTLCKRGEWHDEGGSDE